MQNIITIKNDLIKIYLYYRQITKVDLRVTLGQMQNCHLLRYLTQPAPYPPPIWQNLENQKKKIFSKKGIGGMIESFELNETQKNNQTKNQKRILQTIKKKKR